MHRASAIRLIVVNPGANDPISGESLDFKIMVHKLHQGIDLPTLSEAGNKYSLFPYNGSKETIFAENDGIWVLNNKGTIDGIHYPQDIRNCTGCHADDADLVLNPNLQEIITSEGDTVTMVLLHHTVRLCLVYCLVAQYTRECMA